MSTWLITHPACLKHDTGPGHPERSERLRAVLGALDAADFADLERHEAVPATKEQLARVHKPDYVDAVLAAIPKDGYRAMDADTFISPDSGKAALCAAGAVCMGIDAVLADRAKRVFCAVRPPGHHAEIDHAMGFCLFNNIAVGAAHGAAAHGLHKIAIVDFDVHHGNGTQSMLAGRPEFLYVSTHQHPLYPGTGSRSGNRHGNIRNIPLPPGTGSTEFRQRFAAEGVMALLDFDPDLLLISAGFDAHRDDPLAGLELTEGDYYWVTSELVAVANYCCGGRIVSTLEGGYNLEALAHSAASHVAALME